ncbi:molybdenum cofactor biosynthesis protein MoaE [Georgenia sp. 10Sc9-8]|uniref:Molybdenum cofactor biosynthesis protein MoaE n=1 Tax=Georgenia halotolerans TaxID=3028317 RepID=A0ABT5TY53_9MICO|nr:molybdenum cofactor biosynthesis protein MoaE [Georgenia halotolerans]
MNPASEPTSPDRSRLIPPGRRVVLAEVRRTPVEVAECAAAVEDDAAGAVVTFGGVVRNHDAGRAVTHIEYVGHPSAGEVVADVAADVAARTEIDALAVVHRVGDLAVGDVALAVAVSAAHRAEAFEAAAEVVEAVKRRLPVWKRQVFPDGTHEWTGSA